MTFSPPESTCDWSSFNTTTGSALNLTVAKERELLSWIILTATISFTGIFSNILMLAVTWPKAGRGSFSLLIFHLVTANLFMCLVNVPINIFMVQARRAGYQISPDVCSPVQAVYALVAGVVIWAETGLAVNRFIALFAPYSYKLWTTRIASLSMVAVCWVVSCAIVVPISFGIGGKMEMLPLGQCTTMPKGVLGSIFTTVLTYVPYLIAGTSSVLILWKSFEISRHHFAGEEGSHHRRQLRRRLRLAEMLMVVFLFSAVCNLPWLVIAGEFPFLLSKCPVTLLWLKTCLACQYCFTPCVMLLANSEYRCRLKQMIHPDSLQPAHAQRLLASHPINPSESSSVPG